MGLIEAPRAPEPSSRGWKAVLLLAGGLACVAVLATVRTQPPAALQAPDVSQTIKERVLATIEDAPCEVLREAVHEYGYEAVYPHIGLKQTHDFGQIVGNSLIRNNVSSDVKTPIFRHLAHLAMVAAMKYHSLFAYGALHGAVWYTSGMMTSDEGGHGVWELVRDQMCTRTVYEFSRICIHALGHGGIIQSQQIYKGQDFNDCAKVKNIKAEEIPRAYDLCTGAPSALLEMGCAEGFYHGMVEQFNPAAEGLHHLYPCYTAGLAFPEQCFRWKFLQIPLTTLPGQPFQGFPDEKTGFEADGNVTICMTSPVITDEVTRLACIYGLSGTVFPGGSMYADMPPGAFTGTYYNQYIPDLIASDTPLITWCSRFLGDLPANASVPLGRRDERRWLTCVAGAVGWVLSQGWREHITPPAERAMVCAELQTGPAWMAPPMRRVGHDLCVQATRFSTVSFIRDPNTTTSDEYGIWQDGLPHSWELWSGADINHDPTYALWPLYQFSDGGPRNRPALDPALA